MRCPRTTAAACHVLRESISRLCIADHGNDPVMLNAWLANKTPEMVAAWAAQEANSLLLAVEGDAVLAVGSVTDAGEITLNYVTPEARFRGVSRALLRALEARAVERGNSRCTLTSTATAHRFYRSAGYIDEGEPTKFGMAGGYRMSKEIVAEL
ncbi:GNAT family N-acetyltransferase [Bradyrhizobium sp. RDI18]|uniref:GNAT family N-acetyltransferase n=1 Tax=Bradyrhizobium sp. RDI18 TaxID=3367400 RepID=UPI00371335F0